MSCFHILVMGVAGSGKTTVARALADQLGVEMIEGDEHHPPANVEKMHAGIPLTDDDRRPWLQTLARLIAERHARDEGTVLACSALKRAYRDTLRSAVPPEETFIVELDVDPATLRQRMASRKGHFMPASLLESQLVALEPLEPGEVGMTVDATTYVGEIVAAVVEELHRAT
jgi:gluconokinase